MILDQSIDGGLDFIAAVREATGARVIVCTSECGEDAVLAGLQAGAVGFLRKDTLTTEGLAAAVTRGGQRHRRRHARPARRPDADRVDERRLEHAKPAAARLTDREQQVLALIAKGHPTREVAQQLCYSERTVKNVLHDVVTKLNARSRSQAVAHAVREGLI